MTVENKSNWDYEKLQTFFELEKFNINSPSYDMGWIFHEENELVKAPYLSVIENNAKLTWSNFHEELHEEPSKNHFLDKYERRQVKKLLENEMGKNEKGGGICELGCSTGYMLEEMLEDFPDKVYIGSDLFESGLVKSYNRHPEIVHVQSDICDIPIKSNSMDIVISLNVLEHIEDDNKAIQEIYRILKPAGVACLVVPYGAELYDYYDEIMLHQRRYGKNELTQKCLTAGFSVLFENYLAVTGWLLFKYKKQQNQKKYKVCSLAQKEKLVEGDINSTKDSAIGHILMKIEKIFFNKVKYPFGIRQIILIRK